MRVASPRVGLYPGKIDQEMSEILGQSETLPAEIQRQVQAIFPGGGVMWCGVVSPGIHPGGGTTAVGGAELATELANAANGRIS
jgi:predicted neutral ceramidase superfamily lipid hydrolase